jgi:uncharacterized membrane protein
MLAPASAFLNSRLEEHMATQLRSIALTAWLATACLGVSAAPVAAAPAAAGGTGKHYFVDCAAGNDAASGSAPARAWRTLDRVNTVTFRPGDRISLRRAVTCAGVLAPKGSGRAGKPIVVGAYGAGDRARIAGNGARAAVVLHNVQGWEIRDLDISNQGPAGPSRAGILVLLEDFGIGRHYVVRNVNVHDVTGCDCTGPSVNNSGGILFAAGGSTTATGFAGIRVLDSDVSEVDGIGIGTSSLWALRELNPDGPGTQFVPITGVLIEGNRLTGLGGDGIVIQNGVGSLVQDNLVDGYALRATTFHAGIWAWNSDRTLMQFNEVANGGGAFPALAYDVDRSSTDTTYQYNYSHDNVGGFLLLCADDVAPSDRSIIRYNISQNDIDDPSHGAAIVTVVCARQDNVVFQHNVIYAPEAATLVRNVSETSVEFTNNIFVGRPAGSAISDPVSVFDHNLYHQVVSPPASDQNAVVADPAFVAPGTAASRSDASGYRLAGGSPALGAGVRIQGGAGRDYYGNRVRPGSPANLGVYAGPGVPAAVSAPAG